MSIFLSPGVRTFEHPSGQAVARGSVANRLLAIGMARKGPINTPVGVRSYQQFTDHFGDDLLYGELAIQMRQAFTAGLGDAVVVRAANGANSAALTITDEFNNDALNLIAADAGLLGNMIRVSIDYDTPDPEMTFNLKLWRETRDEQDRAGQAETESFRDLTMDPEAPNFVERAVNGASKLVRAIAVNTAANLTGNNYAKVYSQSGNFFADTNAVNVALGALGANRQITVEVNGRESVPVTLPQPLNLTVLEATINLALTARALSTRVTVRSVSLGSGANRKYTLRIAVSSTDGTRAIRILPGASNDAAATLALGSLSGGIEVGLYSEVRPTMTGITTRLFASPGVLSDEFSRLLKSASSSIAPWNVDFTDNTTEGSVTGVGWGVAGAPDPMNDAGGAEPSLAKLRANLDGMVAALNAAAPVKDSWTFQRIGTRVRATRDDGNVVPSEAARISTPYNYLNAAISVRPALFLAGGLDGNAPLLADYQIAFGHARREVDLFNMLILPRGHRQSDAGRSAVWGAASAFCREQNALLIMDPLSDNNAWSTVDQVVAQPGLTDFKSGVIPEVTCTFWPRVRVPAGRIQMHVDPSGTIAGVIASTIARLGVWNAAAGLSAPLVGVLGLEHPMSEADNGVINPRGINALRAKSTGNVSWGVRTLAGDDAFSNRDFAYIPVRMTTDFIKNSLSAALQDFVFKPNNYVTWASIEMMCRGFMHGLYERKAFAGRSVEDAYQIRIDETTTSPADIASGIMNVWVFFAPLFPAEFIHLHVQHIFQRRSA